MINYLLLLLLMLSIRWIR